MHFKNYKKKVVLFWKLGNILPPTNFKMTWLILLHWSFTFFLCFLLSSFIPSASWSSWIDGGRYANNFFPSNHRAKEKLNDNFCSTHAIIILITIWVPKRAIFGNLFQTLIPFLSFLLTEISERTQMNIHAPGHKHFFNDWVRADLPATLFTWPDISSDWNIKSRISV